MNRQDRRALARKGLLPSGFVCPHCWTPLPPLLDHSGYVAWLHDHGIALPSRLALGGLGSYWTCTGCHASGVLVPPGDDLGPAEWPGLD